MVGLWPPRLMPCDVCGAKADQNCDVSKHTPNNLKPRQNGVTNNILALELEQVALDLDMLVAEADQYGVTNKDILDLARKVREKAKTYR